jgi:hypothetical protein
VLGEILKQMYILHQITVKNEAICWMKNIPNGGESKTLRDFKEGKGLSKVFMLIRKDTNNEMLQLL